jgi:NTP pyrophosphatase (non-canonical NTP hydrolase)
MAEELADILVYLVTLADVVGIDLTAAAFAKLAAARAKFPVAAYQGVAPIKA